MSDRQMALSTDSLAIRVTNLSKRFVIGARQMDRHRTLRDVLASSFKRPFQSLWSPRRNEAQEPSGKTVFWALRDVTFDVTEGETLGIIGRNGAGKSTLLKILSRIMAPTEGRVEAYGRVSSLLEVGTGFHPELTGRENIFLNGAILGMKQGEIRRKFDAIVAFAEVELFIDTPVKHYSSGMYVRLAFAIAAHLEPEILIVDEVLAVGDAAFQRKCLGKMSDVAQRGRTVLFVSHNMTAVRDLCRRTLWLDDGRVEAEGSSDRVVSEYLKRSLTPSTHRVWKDTATAPGNDAFRLYYAAIRPAGGSPEEHLSVRTPFTIEFEYWNLRPDAYVNIYLQLYNEENVLLFEAGPIHAPLWRPLPVGLHRDVCHIPADLLNNGIYRATLQVLNRRGEMIHTEPEVLTFEVHDTTDLREGWYGEWRGLIRPILEWDRAVLKEGLPPSFENHTGVRRGGREQ
jgi:lipopolysaccharide transport system ATP-binding protein